MSDQPDDTTLIKNAKNIDIYDRKAIKRVLAPSTGAARREAVFALIMRSYEVCWPRARRVFLHAPQHRNLGIAAAAMRNFHLYLHTVAGQRISTETGLGFWRQSLDGKIPDDLKQKESTS
jgi:hypothetical protein